MPIEEVPGTALRYHLIAFDDQGRERSDDPAGRMSEVTAAALAEEPITDVFIFSHGWMADLPAARRQYAKWVTAMAQSRADLDQLAELRPAFRPLLVGLHWPSRPWSEEEFGAASFDPTAPTRLVEEYAASIADTPAARDALAVILSAALDDPDPPVLPPEVADAYAVLDREAGLGAADPGGDPGADREPFDAGRIMRDARTEVSFGRFDIGSVLAPLRALSFWKMKDRGRRFGETGGRSLLDQLQQATRDTVRFHLMGHSFGCVVVSAILAGPSGREPVRPVHSAALLQGAFSLWSYCTDIPVARGRPGYFHRAVGGRRVVGPIITSQSSYDIAVGRFYPLGAGVARQVDFAPGELPRYGAVGAFGLRGPGLAIEDRRLLPADQPYDFAPGRIYNLESSDIIRHGEGSFGAHSDLGHVEVTHAVWQAAMATAGS